MADNEPTKKAAPKSDDAATDEEDDAQRPAGNPIDLGTDVDKLPTVPGAGQFMPAEDATEDPAPAPEATQPTKKG